MRKQVNFQSKNQYLDAITYKATECSSKVAPEVDRPNSSLSHIFRYVDGLPLTLRDSRNRRDSRATQRSCGSYQGPRAPAINPIKLTTTRRTHNNPIRSILFLYQQSRKVPRGPVGKSSLSAAASNYTTRRRNNPFRGGRPLGTFLSALIYLTGTLRAR